MPDLDPFDNFIHDRYGWCYYSLEPGKNPIVYNLYTEQKYRRQGYGRKHLQLVIDLIRRTGYTGPINIEVQPRENSIAFEELKAFYKKTGLEVLSTGTSGERGI